MDILVATEPEVTFPEPYGACAQVFLEADLETLPSHGLHDRAIELHDGKPMP